ncbi:hypothetical protein C8Q80DRAFT_1264211 [Daedaleopsis nitida]|nr:hypothetical protein C8Q80DRAFT_1264211 [Daedaleopsis nitida]
MYVNALQVATLALVGLGAQAAPARRDDTAVVSIPNLGNVNATYIPQWSAAGVNLDPAQTPDPTSLLAFMQANSQKVASAVGTITALDIQAALVQGQVTSVLGPSPTGVSVYQELRNATPLVVVSSLGGPAITLATGTGAGTPTTFAGHLLTAAPGSNAAPEMLPRPLVAGALVTVGSVLLGALAVTLARPLIADDFSRFRIYAPLVHFIQYKQSDVWRSLLSEAWDVIEHVLPDDLRFVNLLSLCLRSDRGIKHRLSHPTFVLLGPEL